MRAFKKLHLLQHLFLPIILSFCLSTSASEDALTIRTCGKIAIQEPFSIQTSNLSSPLNHMLLCKSQKLYYRTSLGLFPISSINYTTKLLTITDPSSCSHSLRYVSPQLLSAGFPKTPEPNSLLLFNCSNSTKHQNLPPFIRNSTCLVQACGASSKVLEKDVKKRSSNCFLVDDFEKLDMGFHPIDLDCSHYSRVYRKSSNEEDEYGGFELGTRISFDVPDHVPYVCNECEKPNGNCGVGLRCLCHAKECKDKVISKGGYTYVVGNILVALISFLVVMVSVEF
ncbi:hypothetical protein TorRG33x02_245440 [Trema orientale]|uniref:Wall-associated receptor kinase, galacturonan-binding domain containing protein n=1 Tax=Trema orientale TaxID=63057 RepID=A0A2P5DPP1_TREOI|nr:hypothetical protein TorRG33x02_245440 [Trema orientale]